MRGDRNPCRPPHRERPSVPRYDQVDPRPSVDIRKDYPVVSADLKSADVAIVGGGIVGCATALAARRHGLSVALLERGRICGEASSAAGGLICAQYDADHDAPLFRLRVDGRDAFPEFAQLLEELSGQSIGFSSGPTIGLARTHQQRQQLLARVTWQRQAGLDAQFLEPEEARRREPLLPPDLTGAAVYPDGQVDTQRWPPIVHRALLAAGVRVHQGTDVTAVAAGPNPTVQTVRGALHADRIVLATGAWLPHLRPGVPIVPSRGHMLAFDAPHLKLGHILHLPGGSLAQRSHGRIVFGATKERVGFDRRLRAGAVREMLNRALATLPALADCPLASIWTGFRPEPTDGLPLIGRDPRSGCYLATGHHTHGITMSWHTGQLIARLLTNHPPAYPLHPFTPTRLTT